MIDLRTVEEDNQKSPSIKKGINVVRSWIKPLDQGRFGISFSYGKNEIFVGVSVAKIVTETVVRRREKKVLVRTGETKIIDLQ